MVLTRDEINEVLNTINTLYPRSFNNLDSQRRRDIYIREYTKHLGDLTYKDCVKALDIWVANDESGRAPTVSVLRQKTIAERDKRLYKEGKGTRRIVTEDEQMYNLYLQEMAKPVEKRNEWLIRQCLPSCEIMTNPEAFKKKYGKYREEFEKY